MDIRASNCVFNNGTSESFLIDFDYSGVARRLRYPANFRTQIHDGARHPDAQPNHCGQLKHDDFAMCAGNWYYLHTLMVFTLRVDFALLTYIFMLTMLVLRLVNPTDGASGTLYVG